MGKFVRVGSVSEIKPGQGKAVVVGDREVAVFNHAGQFYAIVSVDVETIDQINIRQAAWRGMHQALEKLEPRAQHVLVDGLRIRWLPYPQTALVQGDAKSYSIAAASVIAKVTRDHLMERLHAEYPQYNFARHKGYATPEHLALLEKHGACPAHRRSFAPIRKEMIQTEFLPPPED